MSHINSASMSYLFQMPQTEYITVNDFPEDQQEDLTDELTAAFLAAYKEDEDIISSPQGTEEDEIPVLGETDGNKFLDLIIRCRGEIENDTFMERDDIEEEVLQPIDLDSDDKAPTYDESICGLRHRSNYQDTSPRWTCPYGGGTLKGTRDAMMIHILRDHFGITTFPQCIHCKRRPEFSSKGVLDEHLRNYHPLKPDVSVSRRYTLEDPSNLLPKPIDMRSRGYNRSTMPRYRQSISIGLSQPNPKPTPSRASTSKWMCPVRGGVGRKGQIHRHIRQHFAHGSEPEAELLMSYDLKELPCKECDFTFTSKQSLITHRKYFNRY
jgi:hypothetical protein